MTLRLFFHSDDLKANVEVLDCTPHENEFAVVLRATLFHPQGGGQPCDTGMIGEVRPEVIQAIPMGRIGHVDEVSELIAFLFSPNAGYITRQVIGVNGGLV